MAEEGFKRKLTAILSADVIEYSRLMRDDEEATVRDLAANRVLITEIIQQHNGRVVDSPGDNILAEFASVVDSVNGAIKIQDELKKTNTGIPENRRMEFRIGINLGDVIEEDERIYGDGVNIAARVEGLAAGGGIAISGTVYEHIKDKLSLGYHYLGEQDVKNIPEPVRVYRLLTEPEDAGKMIEAEKPKASKRRYAAFGALALIILVAGALVIWNYYFRVQIEPASLDKMALPLPDKPSIAVLPFDNMSGDPEQEYLGDALTDQIISGLSKIPNLFVIARNSTFTYKGKPVKVQKVAEDLGVQYVLEGSVQRSPDRVRITAQLIDAITGRHKWSESYDRDMEDIFTIQDSITMAITKALNIELGEGEQARLWQKRSTTNLKAYFKYLEGMNYFYRLTKEDNIRARRLFEEAIELDNSYASAYAFLGYVHFWDARYGWVESRGKSIETAYNYAQKAIEMNDTLDTAHLVIGGIYLLKRQYEKAMAQAERVIAINPNGASNNTMMAGILGCLGRWGEGIEYAKKAIRLAPFAPPGYLWILGRAYFMTGQYDKAVETFKKAVHMNPDYLVAHAFLAASYSALNRQAEATAEAKEVLRINPKFTIESYAKTLPYKNKADIERYMAALRKAGLPEHPPLSLPDKPSIAVLPFDNLSKDPEQEYFADGMADDLITDLSKISGLFVIARNSTLQYKGKTVNVKEVSRELGIRYVLEGSVRKAGDQVRINAQLIDATTGGHLWAERYDGQMDDIFSLQDKITQKIVTALAVKLTSGEKENLASKGTNNIEAYDAFLQGWQHYLRYTPEDCAIAIKYLKKALELDPDYGRAYAALALIYSSTAGSGKEWEEALQANYFTAMVMARNFLNMAMKNPNSLAYRVASEMDLRRRRHEEALRYAEKATITNPNDADSQFSMAQVLVYSGSPKEGINVAQKVMQLDPSRMADCLKLSGIANFQMGQYEEAIASFERALNYKPSMWVQHWFAASYGTLNREKEAKAAFEKYEKRWLEAVESELSITKFDVQLVVYGNPFMNRNVTERLVNGLIKAGLPEPHRYYEVDKKNKLTGDEIQDLVFGRTETGPIFAGGRATTKFEKDGNAFWDGYGFKDEGKWWVEGNQLCLKWKQMMGAGLTFFCDLYRNPSGTLEGKDQYLRVTDFGMYPLSYAD